MLKVRSKIVVVDDDLDNLDVLCCELSSFYDIFPVSDGFFTMEVIADVHPDLILLNPMMPNTGNHLLLLDQAYPHFGDIPILLVSPAESGPLNPQLKVCGSLDCIAKPYVIEEILVKIRQYLPLGS